MQASDETKEKHGLESLWNVEINLDGNTERFEVFNNYKTGRIGESYTFKVDKVVNKN